MMKEQNKKFTNSCNQPFIFYARSNRYFLTRVAEKKKPATINVEMCVKKKPTTKKSMISKKR